MIIAFDLRKAKESLIVESNESNLLRVVFYRPFPFCCSNKHLKWDLLGQIPIIHSAQKAYVIIIQQAIHNQKNIVRK